jgi:hypothetical protein
MRKPVEEIPQWKGTEFFKLGVGNEKVCDLTLADDE